MYLFSLSCQLAIDGGQYVRHCVAIETTENGNKQMGNLHNVFFKVINNGVNDWRAVATQNGVFYTDYEAPSRAAAQLYCDKRNAFYARNTGAYLYRPSK